MSMCRPDPMIKMKKIALILAGGKGTRLWPLSRENYPKQFVEFDKGESLFQSALERLIPCFSPEDIYIVSSEKYKFTILNQIEFFKKISSKSRNQIKKNLIFEPASKNTAPAVLFSFKYLEEERGIHQDYVTYVFPSDHIVRPISKFCPVLKKSSKLAEKGLIVVFGVKPKYPKEGYGYIIPKPDGDLVKRFIEKPGRKQAEALLRKGAYWNSGMFCFKKSVFLNEIRKFKPKMHSYYKRPLKSLVKGFPKIQPDSIDYAVMQKTDKAGFVKFNLNWSDLGSWDSLLNFYSKGGKNFSLGRGEFLDCEDCFIYSKERLASAVGVKDLIIVDSKDSLLIVRKGNSDRVKQLVARLDKKKYVNTKENLTVYRPWGYYSILKESENYKVKEIGVYPKKYISLQKHKYRSEHWNVVEGRAEIRVGKKKMDVFKNESIFVPKKKLHRVYNPSSGTLKIIEVQIGSYLGEDDIERFDRY